MTVQLGSAHGKIVIDSSGVRDGVNQAHSALGRLKSFAATVGTAVASAAAIMGAGMVAAGTKAIRMGSDAQETASLIRNSLGAAADDFAANIDRIADATNRSRYEMAQGVGATIAMTRAMGFGQQQAADYAVSVAQAGADLGSFFNVADDQAILDINSALAGSSEPMQKYGIDTREAALQTVALNHGLIQQGEAMDRSTRATAVMIAIQEQASDAMGDAARTSDSFANQLRGVRGMVVDAATEIGSKLLPMATQIVSTFRGILPGLLQIGAGIAAILMNIVKVGVEFVKTLAAAMGINFDALASDSGTWGENIVVSLASGMAAAASAVIQVLNYIGQIIANLLMPGSPPKLLPKLDQWGAGAMTAYMDGWADGDFSVFDEIANTVEGFLNSLGDSVPETELIPRIMGARSAVSEAIAQMRDFGSVSEEALDKVFTGAGITDDAMRGYIETLFELEAANQAVADAQDEVNRVTQEYDAILSPLNAELSAIKDRQQELKDQEELAEIEAKLADEKLSDLEREQLELRAAEIQMRQKIKAVEDEKDVAVDAAKEKLTAAELAQKQVADEVSAKRKLLDVQEENNSLISDQLSLLESLRDVMGGAGGVGGAAKKLGKAFGDLPKMMEPALASAAGAGDLFASKFDSVFARVSEKFDPLKTEAEELGQTWGSVFTGIGTQVNNAVTAVRTAIDPFIIFLSENKETIVNLILGIGAAFASFKIIGTVVGWITALVAAWGAISTAVTTAGSVLGAIVAFLGGPLTIAIAAISAIIGLFVVAWRNNWGDIQGKTAEAWAFIQPFLQAAWDWLAVNVPAALATLRAWWVDTVWPAIQNAIAVAWPIIQTIFAAIVSFVVETLIPTIAELYTQWTTVWWPTIQTVLQNVWTVIEEVFTEIGRWINDNIIPWVEYLQEVWADTVWPAIQEAVRLMWDFVEPVFQAIKEWVSVTLPPVLNGLRGIFESVMSGINQAIQPVKDLWDQLVGAVMGFWEWISSHTFEFKINLPDLPDWAIPGSPIPLHTAWKNFAEEMARMRIAPQIDLSQAAELVRTQRSPAALPGPTTVNLFGGQTFPNVQNGRNLVAEMQGYTP